MNVVSPRIKEHDLGLHFRRIEGDAVTPAVEDVVKAEEGFLREIAEPARACTFSCVRVGNSSNRRVIVAGALTAPASPEQPPFCAVLYAATTAALPVVRCAKPGD